MRTALVLVLAAGVGGCAVVPPAAWNFNPASWAQPPAPQQAAPVAPRLAQLRIERNAIRSRIAEAGDVRQRLALYHQLHRVGMELSALERQLSPTR